MPEASTDLIDTIQAAALLFDGEDADYDPLIQMVGDARFVLLGGASHGTTEFYRARATITRRLIQELGFTAVAVETDWPDAHRINRYVRGMASPGTTAPGAASALESF